MSTLTSDRGRIQPPNLDDRTWQDLVTQMRDLIPKYAPQWTDHNPSDLGFTLIELFAFLVEGLTYRLNRVPDKNYIAFLNLLGIKRDPPAPAQAFLTFTAAPSGPAHVPVPQGKQAQGPGSESQLPVVFETDEAIDVLPINLQKALLIQWTKSSATGTYTDVSTSLTATPANGLQIPVPPSPDWVELCLGFDNAAALEIRLRIQLLAAIPLTAPTPLPYGTPQANVEWHYSIWPNPQNLNPPPAPTMPDQWPAVPNFPPPADPLIPVAGLQRDGTVRLTLPASPTWASQPPSAWTSVTPSVGQAVIKDNYFWLGIRILNQKPAPLKIAIDYLLFNSASARNALSIDIPEQLGNSTGQPYQTFALKNQPLFRWPGRGNPFDHLVVTVDGTTWAQADDFPAGDAQVYRLDPVAGEISFGNFDATTPVGQAGHGTIPPSGVKIVATSYRYVASGAAGNVGAGTIGNLRTVVPGIIGVTNLFSAFDGADEEAIGDTLRRAPGELRTKDRAVSADDYEYLTLEATTDIAIVRCLQAQVHDADGPLIPTTPGGPANTPAWSKGDPWTFAGIDRSPGNVNAIIVPDQGADVARPSPTQDQIFTVTDYLDSRRDVTARLKVYGPRYVPILVTTEVRVWQTAISGGLVAGTPAVQADTIQKILAFLHPVRGGPAGQGWQVGQHVFLTDLFKAIMPAAEVGYIASLTVQAETPPYYDPTVNVLAQRPFDLGKPAASVRLADYELVCAALDQDKGPDPQHSYVTVTVES